MRDPFESVPLKARNAALGSAIAVAALVLLSLLYPKTMGTIGVLAFFLIFVIGFHEFGHFIFAKRAGMKVTEFFIGFGPRLWSIQRGETEYGIKALPLGGYCKIIGMTNLEEIDPADDDRTFRSKGFFAKLSTLLAGPASHFVLAFFMLWALVAFHGDPATQRFTTTISRVEPKSPAAAAGIQSGDRIVAIDKVTVTSYDSMLKLIHPRAHKDVAIIVARGASTLALHAKLEEVVNPDGTKRGRLGIENQSLRDHPSVMASLVIAPGTLWHATTETVSGFGRAFSPSGFRDYLSNFNHDPPKAGAQKTAADIRRENSRFVSLVGVGRFASGAVESGWVAVLLLLISINISVGLINLLPLIPFDGGHIAVAVYEAVMSKIYRRVYRADFAKILPVAVATLSLFAFIFLSSLFLDVTNPAANPF